MYRYSFDSAITYTSEDIVLFRESPFATWMERLTLENPDHGILPDIQSAQPKNTREARNHIAGTLRAEGRNVVLIDQDMYEPERLTATLSELGITVLPVILPDGEEFKHWETLNLIFDALLQNHCEKSPNLF
jgi:3-dehydroquinate synthetase